MVINHRFQITLAGVACALVAWVAPAAADSFDCRKNETQAECHARLKCKANEELEDCQKRLRAAAQSQGNGNNQDDERSGRDRQSDERSGRDNSDRDRDDRGGDDNGRRDRGDRGGDDNGRRERGGGGGGDRGSRRRGGGGGGGFEANKTFGIGLELGEPTGINGKYFFGPKIALDFGLGYIYRHYYYRRGEGLHVYGDVLFHPVSLVHADAFELPLYIGGGLRFWDFDYCIGNDCAHSGSAIGIRVPIGISFDFNNVPLDFFLQVVPVIDFIRGDYYDQYGDREHFGADFSLGIRFWFK
ncbi:MAG TPA: hypothetical protein VFV99_05955 [Kofleriaceae bacterium]|nr:hypothetical protein [Kofleriaceae bacterium]